MKDFPEAFWIVRTAVLAFRIDEMAMKQVELAMNNSDIAIFTDLYGGKVQIPVHQIQGLYNSTPELRATELEHDFLMEISGRELNYDLKIKYPHWDSADKHYD